MKISINGKLMDSISLEKEKNLKVGVDKYGNTYVERVDEEVRNPTREQLRKILGMCRY